MTAQVVTSGKGELIPEDIKSLLIGLGITLTGAFLTYMTQYISGHDFGTYTPIVVAVWSLFVNIVKKYVTEKQYILKK